MLTCLFLFSFISVAKTIVIVSVSNNKNCTFLIKSSVIAPFCDTNHDSLYIHHGYTMVFFETPCKYDGTCSFSTMGYF